MVSFISPHISSSQPLHSITDYILGIVIKYIQGVSMGSLWPSVNVSHPEAETIAGCVMNAFHTIKVENTHWQYSSAWLRQISDWLWMGLVEGTRDEQSGVGRFGCKLSRYAAMCFWAKSMGCGGGGRHRSRCTIILHWQGKEEWSPGWLKMNDAEKMGDIPALQMTQKRLWPRTSRNGTRLDITDGRIVGGHRWRVTVSSLSSLEW